MSKEFYPQGELCISSVEKREEGFADYRFVADLAASRLGFHVTRNPETEGTTQEEFEAILRKNHPVFLLIVGLEPSENVAKEVKIAIDNCLPIHGFIKTVNGKISKETEEIMKNLSVPSFEYKCAKFENCKDLYTEVYERLKRYICDKNKKFSRMEKGVGLAYRENNSLMKLAEKQIIIYQKTSILILGPRVDVRDEVEFYREILDWLKKGKEGLEFLHVFSWNETINEIRNNAGRYNLAQAQENLIRLYEGISMNKNRCALNIKYSDKCNHVSYVITDTNLIFVLPIEDERFSVELPAHLMKAEDIDKIKDELLKAPSINREKIDELYNSFESNI